MSEAQKSGGNTKFVIIGLLLLGGAVGMFVMLAPSEPPAEPAAPPPVVEEVERVNPMAQQFELEEPEPVDAGAPEPPAVVDEPAPKKPRKKRTGPPKKDAWACEGELDRGRLQSLIRNNRGQVTTCYEKRLKRNNMLMGSLKLTIKVGKDGSVAATKVGGTLRDAEVSACVRKAAKGWKFPPPQADNCAVLSIPFQLSPKN